MTTEMVPLELKMSEDFSEIVLCLQCFTLDQHAGTFSTSGQVVQVFFHFQLNCK